MIPLPPSTLRGININIDMDIYRRVGIIIYMLHSSYSRERRAGKVTTEKEIFISI